MTSKILLIVVLLFAFADPALADWWIVRSSDDTCLVVDIEPRGNDKAVTKVGRKSTKHQNSPRGMFRFGSLADHMGLFS
jgi:hypothetical protein